MTANSPSWHTSAVDTRTLLALLRSPDKALQFYESGHRLPPEYAPRAAGWLIEYLK